MAPGGEGEGKGGRKVRSPEAQAEEETRRRGGERKPRARGIREAPCRWRRRAEERLGWGWPDAARRAPESPSAAGCAGHPSRLSQACGRPGQAGDEEQRRLARPGGPGRRRAEPARLGAGRGGRSAGRRVLPRVPPLASPAPKWRRRRAARAPRDTAPRTRHGGGGSARPRPPQGPGGGFVPRSPVLAPRGAAEPRLPRSSATVTQAILGAPPLGALCSQITGSKPSLARAGGKMVWRPLRRKEGPERTRQGSGAALGTRCG
nr:uncharacterized protein DKFZp434B061-like [Taeniopygia guttata]